MDSTVIGSTTAAISATPIRRRPGAPRRHDGGRDPARDRLGDGDRRRAPGLRRTRCCRDATDCRSDHGRVHRGARARARGPRPRLGTRVRKGTDRMLGSAAVGAALRDSKSRRRRGAGIVVPTSCPRSTSGSSSTSRRTVVGRSPRSPPPSASPKRRCAPAPTGCRARHPPDRRRRRSRTSSASSRRSSASAVSRAGCSTWPRRSRACPRSTTSSSRPGRFDVLIETVAEDNEGLLRFLAERLQRVDGVRDTETFSYLRLVKQTYQFGTR